MFSPISGSVLTLFASFLALCSAQDQPDLQVVMPRLLTNMRRMGTSLNMMSILTEGNQTVPIIHKLAHLEKTLSAVEPDIASLSQTSLDTLVESRASILDLSYAVSEVVGWLAKVMQDGKASAWTSTLFVYPRPGGGYDVVGDDVASALLEFINSLLVKVVDPFHQSLNRWARQVEDQSGKAANEFKDILGNARKDILRSLHDLAQAMCDIKATDGQTGELYFETKLLAHHVSDNILRIVYQVNLFKCYGEGCAEFLIPAADKIRLLTDRCRVFGGLSKPIPPA